MMTRLGRKHNLNAGISVTACRSLGISMQRREQTLSLPLGCTLATQLPR
jgi:hypothetical protein